MADEKKESLSKPAQELLEQYKTYRDDGIVEIKEPIPSKKNNKKDTKTAEIAKKLLQKSKTKRSAIINSLKQNNEQKKSKSKVMGVDESWWNEIEKEEEKFVNDFKHKSKNIALMQKYETLKDPSPFNKDNDMNLQQKWDTFLWNESLKKQTQYLEKKDAKKTKKKKKKVKFADSVKKNKKKQNYGNLVGFFNKGNGKKQLQQNPYLDQRIMQKSDHFTPDKNASFEQKFDVAQNQNFSSTIIASNEFMQNPTTKPIKSILKNRNKKQQKQHKNPAFNGQVIERKPPDMVYTNDQNIEKKQIAQEQKSSKMSLFKQRMNGTENNENSDDVKSKFVVDTPSKIQPKKVKFSDLIKIKKEDICLLFLDVDGVLNCSYSPNLSRAHILRLSEIIRRCANCKICISSSWRINKGTKQLLLNGLAEIGQINVNKVVIGQTPRLHSMDAFTCRPQEIMMFLEEDCMLNAKYNVLRWCVVDDIPLDCINSQFSASLKGHFVKTNPNKGLCDDDKEKIICILNGDKLKTMNKIKEKKVAIEQKTKVKRLKILFLDVDGVLNYQSFDDEGVNGALSVTHLQRLKKIINGTQCKIVLSTSWRRIPSAKEQLFRQLTTKIGLDIGEVVIGDTPVLGSQLKKSLEICQYLKNVDDEKYEIDSWVAIDDLPLDKIGTKETRQMMTHHFVKTDIERGLSEENVLQAIKILNNV